MYKSLKKIERNLSHVIFKRVAPILILT